MPVMKLTQEGIAKLRCSESKRSEQICDAQHRGLLLELRRPRLTAQRGTLGTRTSQKVPGMFVWATSRTCR